MAEKNYAELINKYKKVALENAKNIPLSDAEMEKVTGGVGGANEATCFYCGKPMVWDAAISMWTCDDPSHCKYSTDASDADTIYIIKYMEQNGIECGYPVWWNQVPH